MPSIAHSSNVDVTVLVPVLNEGHTIREAAAAMRGQELDGTLELLFADGGSTDDTRAQLDLMARTDPRIRILENPRRGTASGLNVCLAAARGEFVARMDAHALYPPRYLQAGVDRLRRNDVAWVAGPQVPESRGRVSAAVAAALASNLGRGASRRWSHGGDAGGEYDLDTGVFCGIWRRDELLAQGGWDEGWPRNQDSELAARFLESHRRIVCLPEMAARYVPRDSILGLWRQYRAYGAYRAKTAVRHPISLRRSAVLPPLLVIDAALALAGPRRTRAVARVGMLAYAAVLLSAMRDAARHGHGADPLVPVVLATMHAAHGVGFLEGSCRWGVPWRALRAIALGTGSEEAAPYDGPIDARSLHAEGSDPQR
jgi:glycosyltransferase involved in cell wall biosynthesis